MDEQRLHVCAICGEERTAGQVWFLVAESHWEDKLRILQWQDDIANRNGFHRACCPAHVEELVIHWMTTGTLDFPFAAAAERLQPGNGSLPILAEPDTRGARQIGELSVHRESVNRVLNESPDSLQVILDELCEALERSTAGNAAGRESLYGLASGLARQM